MDLSGTEPIGASAADLRSAASALSGPDAAGPTPGEQVAIVGMALRAAGAGDPDAFWSMLRAGRSGRITLSPEELDRRHARRGSGHVPVQYPLAGALAFDPAAFGMSTAEARFTDPQHRLVLPACYAAAESAGHDLAALPGVVGVYLGAKSSDHGALLAARLRERPDEYDPTRLAVGNTVDYLAARVAYRFGLRGPAITVQTACSSSAVAIHLAAQAILAGECDAALAGGVAVDLQDAGYHWSEGGIYSRRGRCEPYTTSADGTVEGNGVAVVLLRRLDLAIEDDDPVLGVIAGTAVNNDGRDRAGFAAPSVSGQLAVLREALEVAGVDPGVVGLLEGHGTGTRLGDALEIEAATGAYGDKTRPPHLRLHSVKANVGHLSAAAGAAGVIACLLALRHDEIPPNLPLVEGATAVDTAETPFLLSPRAIPWPRGRAPRYAAVSSFGLGGTNAHLIIGEAPASLRRPRGPRRRWQLLPLSTDRPERLPALVVDAREGVRTGEPHDVAHTVRVGRPALPVRAVAVVPAGDTVGAPIWPAGGTTAPDVAPEVVYMLPGQGSMDADVAHGLFAAEPDVAATVERGLAVMRDVLDPDTLAAVRAAFTDGAPYTGTDVAQPVLHLVAAGVHALFDRLGVRPGALVGHSIGEVTAGYLSGVLDFADAARAVCRRGQAMAAAEPGVMYAVREDADRLGGLPAGCCVAARNAPGSTVLSAEAGAEPALLAWLDARGVEHRRLHTAHAFHHPGMAGAVGAFARHLREVTLRPPKVPLMSCRTAAWLDANDATDPGHWGAQLREPVDFAGALRALAEARPDALMVQIGPGTSLVRAARLGGLPAERCVAVLPGQGADAQQTLVHAVGTLWQRGVDVDWLAYAAHDTGRRVAVLPRRFATTPVLHPALVDAVPGIDPAELVAAPVAAPAAPADDPVLAAVAAEWAHLLGAAPGPDDDFLAVGGDSITGGRFVARLRARFPVEIPVHLPLTARTPRGIAAAVDEALIAEVTKA